MKYFFRTLVHFRCSIKSILFQRCNLLANANFLVLNHQKLYNLGARKFVLAGIGMMGCIPSILAQGTTGKCSEDVNKLVLPFNANMRTMINNLSTNLPGSKFAFIDVHNMFQDILSNAKSYGNIYIPHQTSTTTKSVLQES